MALARKISPSILAATPNERQYPSLPGGGYPARARGSSDGVARENIPPRRDSHFVCLISDFTFGKNIKRRAVTPHADLEASLIFLLILSQFV